MSGINEKYKFTIENNSVVAIFEFENGIWQQDVIELNEFYTVDGSSVIRTETEHGFVETTLFTDIDGNGLYSKVADDDGLDAHVSDDGTYEENDSDDEHDGNESDDDHHEDSGSDDHWEGGIGDDDFHGGLGDDHIDGGDDLDTAHYESEHDNYTIRHTDSGIEIDDDIGNDGHDVLLNVERVHFSGFHTAFDLNSDQSAGMTALMLAAAFGSESLSNHAIAGTGISLFDAGLSMDDVAQLIIESGYMNTSDNDSFVRTLWDNVVGTEIDDDNHATFTGDLDDDTYSQAQLLAYAAGTEHAQHHIDLVGLAITGLDFV